MKNVFVAAILGLVNLTAFAAGSGSGVLTPADTEVSFINGRVISVEPLCPHEQGGPVACFVDGTVVTVSFGLNGCADRLGPVAWKADETADGKLKLVISAINIHNVESETLRCFVQATETVQITLINMYGRVEATYLTQGL